MLISIAMETTGLPNTEIEQEILQLAIVDENGKRYFFKVSSRLLENDGKMPTKETIYYTVT